MTKLKDEGIDIAVVGATGLVGESIISILHERKFPVRNLYALASERSYGETISFGNKKVDVDNLDNFDFTKANLAFFSAGNEVSAKYVPKATSTGCIVIDNTSRFRYEDDVPLVIPEVNPNRIADYAKKNIIANPNCSVIQMLVALKPIYDAVGIKKINVATYQSVSGMGKAAITELVDQTKNLLNGHNIEKKVFPHQIAFNILPHIDVFQDNGFTKEEMKMILETNKIMEDPTIQVSPTTARVPVIYGHSVAAHIEMRNPLLAKDAYKLLKQSLGIKVIDNPSGKSYPTAVTHGSGNDLVYVGRIRNDINNNNCLNLWIVADNVRKGGALNSIQIAEMLSNKYIRL